MSGKEEFFQYMGAAVGTVVLAFCLQAGLRSCIDVGYHVAKAEGVAEPALVALRAEEAEALKEANIQAAMAKVAQNRLGDRSIAPKASSDLSAMSGWVQAPDSKPYEPEVVSVPASN